MGSSTPTTPPLAGPHICNFLHFASLIYSAMLVSTNLIWLLRIPSRIVHTWGCVKGIETGLGSGKECHRLVTFSVLKNFQVNEYCLLSSGKICMACVTNFNTAVSVSSVFDVKEHIGLYLLPSVETQRVGK